MSFDGAFWSGEDKQLLRALEHLTPRDQLSPSVGRPDIWVTDRVIERLARSVYDLPADGR